MSGEVVGVDEEPVSCTFDPVVSENSNHGSSREFVLVDQSAQPVVSMYASRMVPEMPAPTVRRGRQRERTAFRCRDLLGNPLMWATPIVVTDVAAKDAFEMGFVHDQKVVEALRPDGAHEPFGNRFRIRGPHGRSPWPRHPTPGCAGTHARRDHFAGERGRARG